MTIRVSSIPADGNTRATFTFMNGGERRRVSLLLTKEKEYWQIADVGEKDRPSLVEYLKEGLSPPDTK
jgi:hypothetical protein